MPRDVHLGGAIFRRVDVTVATLRARVEPFLSELAKAHFRHGAGFTDGLLLDEVYEDHPELSRADSYAMLEEALERRDANEEDKRRLRRLRELVATQIEDARTRAAREEIARLELQGQVPTPRGIKSFRNACLSLIGEEDRLIRGSTERAISDFLLSHARPFAHRFEAAFETARALGQPDYLALRQRVAGIDPEPLANAAKRLLRDTEDAFRDVLGYALRKLDPLLRPLPAGDAARHDLLRLAVAPWLLEHFPQRELLPVVRRSVEELGFHPTAHGRLRVDTEAREGKNVRPFVAAVRVPDDVRLSLRPGQGMEDYLCLLHEYGHALHFAHVSRTLGVEDRRLGDASVNEGFAFVFGHFLLEEKWLRRYLGMTPAQSKEVARIAALNELALLRRHAARLLYELELYRRGPSPAMADDYQSTMEAALFVRVQKGFYLSDVDPQLYGARYLRGWAFEALLHRLLRERFDDDYFRNPSTAQFLSGLFDLGGHEDADGFSRMLAGQPLSLASAGERLVAVLNR